MVFSRRQHHAVYDRAADSGNDEIREVKQQLEAFRDLKLKLTLQQEKSALQQQLSSL